MDMAGDILGHMLVDLIGFRIRNVSIHTSDSEAVIIELALGKDFFKQTRGGRLWDDHFRHLGYPLKLHRAQDAGFRVPRIDYIHVDNKNTFNKKQHRQRSNVEEQQTRAHHTEVRIWDTRKPIIVECVLWKT